MKINEEFMQQLKEKYKKSIKKDWENFWDTEQLELKKILEKVENGISHRFEIISPINIGGAGIILKVLDNNLNISQALKCPRPVKGKEILLSKILASEITRLKESSHPNIIPIFYQGEVDAFDQKCPYYIMEYIDGAVDAYDYIIDKKPDFKWIVMLLKQCVEGIKFLHSKNTIHCDIKLENILVSPDGNTKISDLGSARLIDQTDSSLTTVTFTRDFAHPGLNKLQVSSTFFTDPNRIRTEIERSRLKSIFDIYALGKNILRILKAYDVSDKKKITTYQRNYLSLMACRMLDELNLTDDEFALGLPVSCFAEIKYTSTEKILLDLKKISGEYTIHSNIPELDHHSPKTIQISSSSPSSFTERLSKLLKSPLLKRLARVSQLGLVAQVYPTATHTRFQHVLGTFYNVTKYCDSLWNDPVNPLFKQIIDENDINAVLLAALCHDLGHYPLAHDLEEADSEMFSHKKFTENILQESDSKSSSELRKLFKDDWNVDVSQIIKILNADPTDIKQEFKQRMLHTLIDGPIDADKLDYLIRDSINLNVPYGNSIDVDRLLRCLTIIFKRIGSNIFISLGVHEKGKIPAEAVAFCRYAMFGSVYWHHSTRSLKAMLNHATWESLPTTADRRSKEYKKYQDDLSEEISKYLGIDSISSKQKSLFRENEMKIDKLQINAEDFEMLSFIFDRTSENGKLLIKMICERKLYKRLLVISPRKNERNWEILRDFRKNCTWIGWKSLQCRFQNLVIDLLKNLNDNDRTVTALEKNVTDEIISRSYNGELLLLIDIPADRKGSTYGLDFLKEERFDNPFKVVQKEKDEETEDSIVWNSLAKDFSKSVGKARIFCYPDYIYTFSTLKRSDLESCLESAINYVSKEISS
jgi:HD superfamily phosphohydrolase